MSGAGSRLRAAASALDRNQRFAAGAALALLVTMFLPWYEKSVVVAGSRAFAKDTISAFGAVSFVEAAIFLVAAGVLALVFARAEGGTFHLPGGDGTVILAAGLWAAGLIFFRVFDRPDVSGDGGTVGIQWGFFVAFVAAGTLAYAGARMRAAARPTTPVREPRPSRRTPASDAVVWSDEPMAPGAREPRTSPPVDGAPAGPRAAGDRAVRREDARVTVDDPPAAPQLRAGETTPASDSD